MAFTSTKISVRQVSVDNIEALYSFASDSGSTGGEIDATAFFSFIEFADPVTETTEAGTTIKVVRNSSANGQVTITTVSNESGRIKLSGKPARS